MLNALADTNAARGAITLPPTGCEWCCPPSTEALACSGLPTIGQGRTSKAATLARPSTPAVTALHPFMSGVAPSGRRARHQSRRWYPAEEPGEFRILDVAGELRVRIDTWFGTVTLLPTTEATWCCRDSPTCRPGVRSPWCAGPAAPPVPPGCPLRPRPPP